MLVVYDVPGVWNPFRAGEIAVPKLPLHTQQSDRQISQFILPSWSFKAAHSMQVQVCTADWLNLVSPAGIDFAY